MKKLIILLCYSLLIPIIAFADTHIPGGNVSGIWTIGNSPYIIDSLIIIPLDSLLTIEPGVKVIFSGYYSFIILGRLLAEGANNDTITFTVQDTTLGWHGLRFSNINTNNQDSSKVVYCKLKYGKATNYYDDYHGGAIYCTNSSNILIKNCLITKNIAGFGGGIYCEYSNPSLENIIITSNSTHYDGGGIYCNNDSSPNLVNVTISSNSTNYFGGGIYCNNNSNPSLVNVTITGNSAGYGGGIYCNDDSNPSLVNVTITGNSASFGGGIYCYESNPSLVNVTISINSANNFGGGIGCYNSNPILSNVTISGNIATYGGGIHCYNSFPVFNSVNRSNIFLNFANLGNDLYSMENTTIDVIVNTFTVLIPNEHFTYPIDNFTFDILNSKIDQANHDLYVSPFGSDYNSGLNIESPLRTISWALAIIISDNTNLYTIHVANGTYSQSNTGEKFPLHCRSYISLQGEEEDLTILDGEGLNGIFKCDRDSCFSIKNMTLQNGNTDYGGGIYCSYSNPSLENVTITSNSTSGDGGGIYCDNSNLSLCNVTLLENTANSGGGIYSDSSIVSIENATINENISSSRGGGIYCIGSAMVLTDITISRNISSQGSGIYCMESSQNLTNVAISGNNASIGAGIICLFGSSDLRNVTITKNTADDNGGGIFCNGTYQLLFNCVLWNNVPEEIYKISDTIIVNYSDIKNGWEGLGNINEDPLFADPENENFHLTENSPCIDTGNPDTTGLNLPFWDLDFKHRIWDGNGDGIAIIDMGCYEYGSTPLRIYPGDTNNDGIVDTLDILPIGQYFRKTGGLRETASLEWEPQVLPKNWVNINYAYADCNGDGEINIADVLAICVNWGKTHEDTGIMITFTIEELQENIDNFQQIYDNLEDIGLERIIKNHLANVFGFPSIPGNLIYLSQNYPNPFNSNKIGTTIISFYIAEFTENAEIKIYNIKGQLVKKLSIDSNQFSIKWDGKNESGKPVSSGIYFYQLSTKGKSSSGGESNNYKSEIKKMILIK